MIDLVLKLIERCIALVKRREETNRTMYTDFIAPAFADLAAVHRNYLDSFQRYRDMIMNADFVLNRQHPVIDTVAKDGLFSADLRSKISTIYELRSDSVVGNFIEANFNYMNFASRSDPVRMLAMVSIIESVVPNAARSIFSRSLDRILQRKMSQEKKRELVVKMLDRVVAHLQSNYNQVILEHAALKRKLLMPK